MNFGSVNLTIYIVKPFFITFIMNLYTFYFDAFLNFLSISLQKKFKHTSLGFHALHLFSTLLHCFNLPIFNIKIASIHILRWIKYLLMNKVYWWIRRKSTCIITAKNISKIRIEGNFYCCGRIKIISVILFAHFNAFTNIT